MKCLFNKFTVWSIAFFLPIFILGMPQNQKREDLSKDKTALLSKNYNLSGVTYKTFPEQPSDSKKINVVLDEAGDTLIAKAGKYNIKLKDYLQRLTDYLASGGVRDNIPIRRSIATNMLNEILLKNYDNNESIYKDKNYKQEIAWTKKQAILSFLLDREVYAKITATDQELRQAFVRVNEKIAARHLYAQTEEEAWSLYDRLMRGETFQSLAKEVFTDSTLRNNGGYLGYFTWGDMDPDFEEAAYALKIGEISKPVKTVYGYSIIRIEDRVPSPILTENEFLNNKHSLIRTLRIKKKGPATREYVSRIYNASKVKFNEKEVEAVFNNLNSSSIKEIEVTGKRELNSAWCADYDGNKYSALEISRRVNEIPYFHRSKITTVDALKEVIKGLILQDKLMHIALSKRYDKDPLVNSMYDKMKDMVFLKYKRAEIIDKSEIPDTAVKNFYTRNLKQFTTPGEMDVQEIIVNRQSLADSLKNMFSKGEDFGTLAEKYSMRPWSAKNKGDMGYAPLDKFGMMKDRFWKSNIGELIGPVKIENMYGLFRVTGKKQGQQMSFDLVKADAEHLAKKEMQSGIMQDYLDRLNKKVPVTIYEDLLSSFALDEVYEKVN